MANDNNNAKTLRGTLIMVAGIALLLHTLGLIEAGLSFVLVVIAISCITYGCYISGLYDWIRSHARRS